MKPFSFCLLPMIAILAGAGEPNPATTPSENPDPDRSQEYNWKERHEQVKTRIAKGGVNLIFIGDSITHYFGGEPAAKIVRAGEVWQKYYGNRQVVNLGFGWDRTQHMLWRLENGEIDGITPKVTVVMAGVNNLMNDDTAEQTAEGIRAICDLIGRKLPQTRILLLGVLPFGEQPGPQRDKVKANNNLIARFADNQRIYFLDVGGKFVQPDGTISKEVLSDFLHPAAKGYQILAESIEPKLAELLGEPPVK